ncbi:pregnancy-specific glycoprotein 22-like [Meriones unguiculatus]|uniref:pregnancy-specific glycoprotein 22-like n=1 Tax=Meriones unguiculatus TaxID=10047 RepID=UPI00293E7523|nr:pregnancy-specific glycoprotein 22-like [Meriones unguiculatus]
MTSSLLPCKGCTSWKELLLTASLLTCWHLSTTADVIIELVPPQVVEGENVLLLVHNLPRNLIALAWYKGTTNVNTKIVLYALNTDVSVLGPVHNSKGSMYRNGSLRIDNVTLGDTGYYTLRTFNRQVETVSVTSTYLHVNTFLWNCGRLATSAQPTIESLPTIVPEGEQVVLRVHSLPENIHSFAWFKGMTVFGKLEIGRYILARKSVVLGPAYSGRENLFSDGSLLFYSVTQKDAGLYTLQVLGTDMKSEEAHVEIQVDKTIEECCSPVTTSQVLIVPVPRYAAEGESVLLLVHNLPKDVQAFSWYKSMYNMPSFKIVEYNSLWNTTTWGHKYSGRGMVYPSGHLLLQDVTQSDARMYTLEVLNKDDKIDRAHVQFYVNKPVTQPVVKITDTTVRGNRSVMFTCVSPDTGTSIRWFFNNNNLELTERMTLSPTKCGLRVDPVTSEDAGEYRCLVTNRLGAELSYPVRWP